MSSAFSRKLHYFNYIYLDLLYKSNTNLDTNYVMFLRFYYEILSYKLLNVLGEGLNYFNELRTHLKYGKYGLFKP